jgi:hypothetical protein
MRGFIFAPLYRGHPKTATRMTRLLLFFPAYFFLERKRSFFLGLEGFFVKGVGKKKNKEEAFEETLLRFVLFLRPKKKGPASFFLRGVCCKKKERLLSLKPIEVIRKQTPHEQKQLFLFCFKAT